MPTRLEKTCQFFAKNWFFDASPYAVPVLIVGTNVLVRFWDQVGCLALPLFINGMVLLAFATTVIVVERRWTRLQTESAKTQVSLLLTATSTLDVMTGNLLNVSAGIAKLQQLNTQQKWQLISQLLSPLIAQMRPLLYVRQDTLHNIRIYIEDSAGLFCIWRHSHENTRPRNRVWPTDSKHHIARCFTQGEVAVIPELRLEEHWEKDDALVRDQECYKSALLAPVFHHAPSNPADNQTKVRGVLVVTSNHIEEFDRANSKWPDSV